MSRPRLAAWSLAVAWLATAFVCSTAGCGGAAPPSAAAPAPTSADDAKIRFDEADRELRLAMGEPLGFAGQPGAVPPNAPGPAAAQPAPPPPPAVRAETDSGGATAKSAADPCRNACVALASMRRAATQLCALAGGDGDPRCASAKDRVKQAGDQVHAKCPACTE